MFQKAVQFFKFFDVCLNHDLLILYGNKKKFLGLKKNAFALNLSWISQFLAQKSSATNLSKDLSFFFFCSCCNSEAPVHVVKISANAIKINF